jgi:hypothetical protein
MRQGREAGGAVEKHGAGSGGGTSQDLTCGKQKKHISPMPTVTNDLILFGITSSIG